MVQIYWQVNNSANLKKFNWESLQVIDAKNINITPFEWYKNKLQDKCLFKAFQVITSEILSNSEEGISTILSTNEES